MVFAVQEDDNSRLSSHLWWALVYSKSLLLSLIENMNKVSLS